MNRWGLASICVLLLFVSCTTKFKDIDADEGEDVTDTDTPDLLDTADHLTDTDGISDVMDMAEGPDLEDLVVDQECPEGYTGGHCEKVLDCAGQPNFTLCEVATDSDRYYDICVNGTCVSPGCGEAPCNPPGPHFPLADSGQRDCYGSNEIIACPGTPGDPGCASTAWCGQDAQYGWDVEHEETERFSRSAPVEGEPIVTDNVTGLVWQGCVPLITGVDCDNGSLQKLSWENAVSYCDSLVWGGADDWHMPDRYELQSIVDYSHYRPAIHDGAFPATPGSAADGKFWSISTDASDPANAWTVYFEFGAIHPQVKGNAFAVRCVRIKPPDETARRFERITTVAAEPVVADHVTGLMWQGCAGDRYDTECTSGSITLRLLEDALAYCESLSWGGYVDWHLPNVMELFSITDDHFNNPAIDRTVFPNSPNSLVWSSTTYPPSIATGTAWCHQFDSSMNPGILAWAKTGGLIESSARCVRDNP